MSNCYIMALILMLHRRFVAHTGILYTLTRKEKHF